MTAAISSAPPTFFQPPRTTLGYFDVAYSVTGTTKLNPQDRLAPSDRGNLSPLESLGRSQSRRLGQSSSTLVPSTPSSPTEIAPQRKINHLTGMTCSKRQSTRGIEEAARRPRSLHSKRRTRGWSRKPPIPYTWSTLYLEDWSPMKLLSTILASPAPEIN